MGGEIPSGLGTLNELDTLDLSNNELVGIDQSLNWTALTNLTSIDLSGNTRLRGDYSALLKLPQLTSIKLHGTLLVGEFPAMTATLTEFTAPIGDQMKPIRVPVTDSFGIDGSTNIRAPAVAPAFIRNITVTPIGGWVTEFKLNYNILNFDKAKVGETIDDPAQGAQSIQVHESDLATSVVLDFEPTTQQILYYNIQVLVDGASVWADLGNFSTMGYNGQFAVEHFLPTPRASVWCDDRCVGTEQQGPTQIEIRNTMMGGDVVNSLGLGNHTRKLILENTDFEGDVAELNVALAGANDLTEVKLRNNLIRGDRSVLKNGVCARTEVVCVVDEPLTYDSTEPPISPIATVQPLPGDTSMCS